MRPAIGAAIFGIMCFNTNLSAQPDKQLNELQQRCGRLAKEVLIGNTALPYWIPNTDRPCSTMKITTAHV